MGILSAVCTIALAVLALVPTMKDVEESILRSLPEKFHKHRVAIKWIYVTLVVALTGGVLLTSSLEQAQLDRRLDRIISDTTTIRYEASFSSNGGRRTISESQSRILLANMDGIRGRHVAVEAMLGDPESIGYAQQIIKALEQSGIKTAGLSQAVFQGNPPPLTIECITVIPINPKAEEVQTSLLLRSAFVSAGLIDGNAKIVVRKVSTGKKPFVRIVVGPES